MSQSITVTFGPWVWPLFASAFIAMVTWFKIDDSPTGDYGHIGQGMFNLIVMLVGAVAVLVVWLLYFAWRAHA